MYDNGDGVSIVCPAPGLDPTEVAKASVAKGVDYKIINDNQLPADRVFRDAWTMTGIDLKKAKAIWMDKIRAVRGEMLKELDVQWIRAMENGESKLAGDIAAKKQQLRDITSRKEFSKIKKVEDIQNFWPEILEG
jgi:hypothetical protein